MIPARTTRPGTTGRTLNLLLGAFILVMLTGILAAAFALSSLVVSDTPAAAPVAQSAPAVGSPAPEILLPRLEQGKAGTPSSLVALRGQPVLLNFWATWCQPCREEFLALDRVYQAHRTTDRLAVIGVNVDDGSTPAQVQAFVDGVKTTFPIWLSPATDFTVEETYDVKALPTTLFIDETGVIRKIHIGGPMTEKFIEEQLKASVIR